MKTIALFPGLDGMGDLYAPLQSELSEFNTQIFPYPSELIEPEKIAQHFLASSDFSEIDVFVAESFGCRVLYELSKLQVLHHRPVIFIAGFSSISARYKLLLKGPNFILQAFYEKASSEFLLNRYCLGNTKNTALVKLLKKTLQAVPYKTVIERLRYIAKTPIKEFGSMVTNSKFFLAMNDNLLTKKQQRAFAETIDCDEIFELDGPHFLAQTKPAEVARVIKDSLQS